MTTQSDGFAVGSPLELPDRLTKLEERLSQVEAALLYGPGKPSQAALDEAAKREIVRLREAASMLAEQLARLAIVHHGTRTNSKLHRPEDQGFRECPCATCRDATATLARYAEGD